ncbi:hypothetical protein HDV03_003016 [Kappamyces sp. JEL0829]|nr:hypothetical protein HDV03_003016 [Kappamyces sp. JEL0829]
MTNQDQVLSALLQHYNLHDKELIREEFDAVLSDARVFGLDAGADDQDLDPATTTSLKKRKRNGSQQVAVKLLAFREFALPMDEYEVLIEEARKSNVESVMSDSEPLPLADGNLAPPRAQGRRRSPSGTRKLDGLDSSPSSTRKTRSRT